MTDHVWHDGKRFKVIHRYSPSKYQDWLILAEETNSSFADGSIAMNVFAIEDGNDEWLPDTPQVRELIEKEKALEKALKVNKKLSRVQEELSELAHKIWDDKPDEFKW